MHVTLMFHDGEYKGFPNARNLATQIRPDGEELLIVTMSNGDTREYQASEVAGTFAVFNDDRHPMRGIARQTEG